MKPSVVFLLVTVSIINPLTANYLLKNIMFEIDQKVCDTLARECNKMPSYHSKSPVQELVHILNKNNCTITLTDLIPILEDWASIPTKYLSKEVSQFLQDLTLVAKAPQFFASLNTNNIIVCNDGCFGGDVVIDGNVIVNGTSNITGIQGPPGPPGPTGPQGTVGATGLQGPTGTCFQNNFAHVYDTTQQAAPLTFTNITMNTNGELGGWTHTPGSAILTCPEDGRYLIIYTAQVSEISPGSNADIGFQMLLNGAVVDQSKMAVASEPITEGTNPSTRTFIQVLNAGDTLRFQFRADQVAGIDGIDFGNNFVGYIVTGASFAVTITQITT